MATRVGGVRGAQLESNQRAQVINRNLERARQRLTKDEIENRKFRFLKEQKRLLQQFAASEKLTREQIGQKERADTVSGGVNVLKLGLEANKQLSGSTAIQPIQPPSPIQPTSAIQPIAGGGGAGGGGAGGAAPVAFRSIGAAGGQATLGPSATEALAGTGLISPTPVGAGTVLAPGGVSGAGGAAGTAPVGTGTVLAPGGVSGLGTSGAAQAPAGSTVATGAGGILLSTLSVGLVSFGVSQFVLSASGIDKGDTTKRVVVGIISGALAGAAMGAQIGTPGGPIGAGGGAIIGGIVGGLGALF
jgi:hypothetical protein